MKVSVLIILLTLTTLTLFANTPLAINLSNSTTASGIGLGSVIAVMASWSRNQSVLWAILHAIFGWVYVIYFVITR
ncbi:MAG: hypothetical protein LC107_05145 [Chitinophagales bacterium]|nr:hypothetical protein [Chitinophagales bacterium]